MLAQPQYRTQVTIMNKAAQYILLIVSLPLGYLASYFAQNQWFKLNISLGDYASLGFVLSLIGGIDAKPEIASASTTARLVTFGLPILIAVLMSIFGSKDTKKTVHPE